MGDKRDPERTKAALLDAALVEFATHGRAGARTSAIAERAGVNKQLISHHFGGKDGLYAALVARWEADEAAYGGPDTPLADIVARYVEAGAAHRDLHRLLLRASLEDEEDGGGVGAADLGDMRARQAAGEITDALDPAFLLLALQSIAAAGLVFPGDVRRLTGEEPDSPAFVTWHAEQLRRLVELIRPAVSKSAAPVRRGDASNASGTRVGADVTKEAST
jgi:TetR/AcrR family transcriptional regulator